MTSRFPFPLEKGDKLRLYHQLKQLATHHRIVLCALCETMPAQEHLAELERYCEAVYALHLPNWKRLFNVLCSPMTVLGRRPLQVTWFYDRALAKRVDSLIERHKPQYIYCQLVRASEYVRGRAEHKTLDYMDTLSVNMQRWAESCSVGLKRWLLKREARVLADYERSIYGDFQSHFIISAQDADLLPLSAAESVTVLPNGIDRQAFMRSEAVEALPLCDVCFVGNMGYAPNVEAAVKLVQEVMPLVWRLRPDATLLIAGARPAKSVLALAQDRRVRVSGWLADIRSAYMAGRVFAAPLSIGSGQQNKILEAMSMRLPCVTTSLVNNAIGAVAGSEIMIADDIQTFAEHIIALLDDPDKAADLAQSAEDFVSKRFEWTNILAFF